ncbi:MAG: hypothetical protein AAGC55_06545, partial [Myxococcota bacterium]
MSISRHLAPLVVGVAAMLAAEPAAAATVAMEIRADRPTARTGDVVHYTVVVTNDSARDLTAAAGQAVFIRDIPTHGLAYVRGRAVARIESADQVAVLSAAAGQFADTFENTSSRRIVRFGPFDLPAGARLVLTYQVVVGLDTRPGQYDNRAVAVDAGGVYLSEVVSARVRIAGDADFDAATILGRVYCDDDGDGRRDDDEFGVMGARVYIDTGSYAVTDSDGLYHFVAVAPGGRLVKLDPATLAGGRPLTAPDRLLRLSSGVIERADFAVSCALETIDFRTSAEITGGDAAGRAERSPPLSEPATQVAVDLHGAVDSPTVTVAGQSVELPRAELQLEVPAPLRASGQRNLVAVPPGGYDAEQPLWRPRWQAPDGVDAVRWTLRIGALAPGSARALRTITGTGPLPATIAWDGRDDAGAPVPEGTLCSAQLVVIGSQRRAEAASAERAFGVAYGVAPAAPVEEVWTGRLFDGRDRAGRLLSRRVAALAERLGAGDRVEIEVHSDGRGSRLSALTRTQVEARRVAELFLAAGVAEQRITARGRGSLVPVVRGRTRAARRANRRVVVRVVPPGEVARPIPETVIAERTDVLIAGQSVAVADGRFSHRVAGRPGAAVLVDIQAADGRRAAIEVAVPVGADGRPGQSAPLPGSSSLSSSLFSSSSGTTPGAVVSAAEPSGPPQVAAGDTTLWLPAADAVLGAEQLAVRGVTRPGNRVAVTVATRGRAAGAATAVPVSGDGRFAALVPVPAGASEVTIAVSDTRGHRRTVRRPVQVAERALFVMAAGEILGSSAHIGDGWSTEPSYLSGMTEDSTFAIGPVLVHGRLALYLKGRITGLAAVDRLDFTAHVDSARPAGGGAFFTDATGPAQGDQGDEVSEANTRRKVFVEVAADRSRAVIGSVHSDLRGISLFRYDRTVDGVAIDFDSAGSAPAAGRERAAGRAQVRVFAGDDREALARDVNWYRATGGALYYLRHGQVIAGSERVRVVVRDARSGLVTGDRVLLRGR